MSKSSLALRSPAVGEAGWAVIPLRDLLSSVRAGVSVNSEDRPHGTDEIGVLKTSAVSGGIFHPDLNKTVIPKECHKVAEPVMGSSILLSRMNTPNLVGESCLVADDWPHLFLPDRLWQLRINPKVVNVRWLAHKLQDWQSRTSIQICATGTSGSMKNLSKVSLLSMRIACPPLSEQRVIAEILDTLDDQIRTTGQIIDKLRLTKQGLAGDILPVNGQVQAVPLREVSVISGGVTLGSEPSGPGTIRRPYLRVANVQDGHLNLSEVKYVRIRSSDLSRYSLAHGDVLMNEGGDADKLGRGTVWKSQIAGCLHQNHVFRVRTDRRVLEPWYLAHISGSAYGKKYFLRASKQTTNLATINSTQIGAFPVPIPPLEEQQRIVEIISSHDTLLDAEQVSLNRLRSLKSGLMSDLLTGRVRVPLETVL